MSYAPLRLPLDEGRSILIMGIGNGKKKKTIIIRNQLYIVCSGG